MKKLQQPVLLLIGGSLLLLLGYKAVQMNRFYTLFLTIESVVTIEKEATVQILGIDAGEVSDITRHGSGLCITLKIDKKYRIPRESEFRVVSVGILGEKAVAVKTVKNSEFLEHKDTVALEADISADVGKLFKRVGDLFGEIETGIDSTLTKILDADSVVQEERSE